MWNLDDLNFLAPHSIDNSVGTFDYFSVLRATITGTLFRSMETLQADHLSGVSYR